MFHFKGTFLKQNNYKISYNSQCSELKFASYKLNEIANCDSEKKCCNNFVTYRQRILTNSIGSFVSGLYTLSPAGRPGNDRGSILSQGINHECCEVELLNESYYE